MSTFRVTRWVVAAGPAGGGGGHVDAVGGRQVSGRARPRVRPLRPWCGRTADRQSQHHAERFHDSHGAPHQLGQVRLQALSSALEPMNAAEAVSEQPVMKSAWSSGRFPGSRILAELRQVAELVRHGRDYRCAGRILAELLRQQPSEPLGPSPRLSPRSCTRNGQPCSFHAAGAFIDAKAKGTGPVPA